MTPLRIHPRVAAALRDGRPVVGLESSVLAQGLPVPANRDAERRMRTAILSRAAIPAITAVIRGVPSVGITDDELERFLGRSGIEKVSARDLPRAMVTALDGATTVAGALALCRLAAIPVFATGGIGGVHRGVPFDESADLIELARSPAITVCAGAKAILDIGATLERLETLGVQVVGFRTDEFPGFFTRHTGFHVTAVAQTAADVAAMFHAARALRLPGGLLLVQPPPAGSALDAGVVAEAVDRAVDEARIAGVHGPQLTPFLLAAVERATGGQSLAANVALLESNAALAADVAVALAALV